MRPQAKKYEQPTEAEKTRKGFFPGASGGREHSPAGLAFGLLASQTAKVCISAV